MAGVSRVLAARMIQHGCSWMWRAMNSSLLVALMQPEKHGLTNWQYSELLIPSNSLTSYHNIRPLPAECQPERHNTPILKGTSSGFEMWKVIGPILVILWVTQVEMMGKDQHSPPNKRTSTYSHTTRAPNGGLPISDFIASNTANQHSSKSFPIRVTWLWRPFVLSVVYLQMNNRRLVSYPQLISKEKEAWRQRWEIQEKYHWPHERLASQIRFDLLITSFCEIWY